MSFTDDQKKMLDAKLEPARVKERQGFSYIEGWWAISEANRIFGPDQWTRETIDLVQLGEPYEDRKNQWRVNYRAKVRVTVCGVVKEGCGFGQGIDRDVGKAHESALKEAETDAMKRAMMMFGNPFGLALYDKKQTNVGENPPEDDGKRDVNPESWGERRGQDILDAMNPNAKQKPSTMERFKAHIDMLARDEGAIAVEEYWRREDVQAFWSNKPRLMRDDAQAYMEETIEGLIADAREAAE